MRRRRLLLGAGLLALLVGAGLLIVTVGSPPAVGITRAKCNRIQVGMTEAQVEYILEGPATVRKTVALTRCVDPHSGLPQPPARHLLQEATWLGNGLTVQVEFNSDERVYTKHITGREDTFFDRLRARLGW